MKGFIRKISIIFVAAVLFLLAGMTAFGSEAEVYSITIHWDNPEGWDVENLQECIFINGNMVSGEMLSINEEGIHISGINRDDRISFTPGIYQSTGAGGGGGASYGNGVKDNEEVVAATEIVLEEELTIIQLEDEDVPLANIRLEYVESPQAVARFNGKVTSYAMIGIGILAVSMISCFGALFSLTSGRRNRDE